MARASLIASDLLPMVRAEVQLQLLPPRRIRVAAGPAL